MLFDEQKLSYPAHGASDRDPAGVMVDRKEPGRVDLHLVHDVPIVPSVLVRGVHLQDPLPYHAALLDTRTVLGEVKHGRVVVLIADLHSERAESGETRPPVVLRCKGTQARNN